MGLVRMGKPPPPSVSLGPGEVERIGFAFAHGGCFATGWHALWVLGQRCPTRPALAQRDQQCHLHRAFTALPRNHHNSGCRIQHARPVRSCAGWSAQRRQRTGPRSRSAPRCLLWMDSQQPKPSRFGAGQASTQTLTVQTPVGNIGQTYAIQIQATAGQARVIASQSILLTSLNAACVGNQNRCVHNRLTIPPSRRRHRTRGQSGWPGIQPIRCRAAQPNGGIDGQHGDSAGQLWRLRRRSVALGHS